MAETPEDRSPDRGGLVLVALILVAAVANLNLAVANVALPDIGEAFDSSQTTLDLIAVGYSLGLAASVIYLGGLGDRYGLDGADWAYTAGIVAILIGAAIVFFLFPGKDEEARLLAGYHRHDTAAEDEVV
jgi:MFS family permease